MFCYENCYEIFGYEFFFYLLYRFLEYGILYSSLGMILSCVLYYNHVYRKMMIINTSNRGEILRYLGAKFVLNYQIKIATNDFVKLDSKSFFDSIGILSHFRSYK